MNKVVVENVLLEKINEERFAIVTTDREGRTVQIEITAKAALQIARLFIDWVCSAWLD
jgi:hypothetical protein